MISPEYQGVLREKRKQKPLWGSTAHRHAEDIGKALTRSNTAAGTYTSVMDFGCGTGTLVPELQRLDYLRDDIRIELFDPSIEEFSVIPNRDADLLLCIDVMEHVEESYLPAILACQSLIAKQCLHYLISTVPAGHLLPDGRNAHLIVKPHSWWYEMLEWGLGGKFRCAEQWKAEKYSTFTFVAR